MSLKKIVETEKVMSRLRKKIICPVCKREAIFCKPGELLPGTFYGHRFNRVTQQFDGHFALGVSEGEK